MQLDDSARSRSANERAVRAGRRLDRSIGHASERSSGDIVERIAEVGVIEHIVHIRPNSETNPLCELEALQDAEVGIEVVRSTEEVTTSVAKGSVPHRTRPTKATLELKIRAGSEAADRLTVTGAIGGTGTNEGWQRAEPRGKPG